MKKLYKELQERMLELESIKYEQSKKGKSTKVIEGRILESTLVIIRVQQLLLDSLV